MILGRRTPTPFEKRIGYRFRQEDLLSLALTHRSYANEQGVEAHYERLEFLGDAVLELIVTDFLYKKYPKYTEGELTAVRFEADWQPFRRGMRWRDMHWRVAGRKVARGGSAGCGQRSMSAKKTRSGHPAQSGEHQASAREIDQRVAPQDDRVFDRLRIVGPSNAGDSEAKPFVQAARRLVRAPHLQRRARGSGRRPLGQRAGQ